MGVILDTGIIILAERGLSDLAGILKGERYGISAVTVSELFFGFYRANSPARRARREEFIATVLEQIPVHDFTTPIARIHARLRSTLTERGQIIGAHDLMIAATALHLGWSVKTTNESEFRRVEGLDVIGSSR
jgi:tRNA(fMet)-specific endonuclease VapC